MQFKKSWALWNTQLAILHSKLCVCVWSIGVNCSDQVSRWERKYKMGREWADVTNNRKPVPPRARGGAEGIVQLESFIVWRSIVAHFNFPLFFSGSKTLCPDQTTEAKHRPNRPLLMTLPRLEHMCEHVDSLCLSLGTSLGTSLGRPGSGLSCAGR